MPRDLPPAPVRARLVRSARDAACCRALVQDLRTQVAAQFRDFLAGRRDQLRPLADPEATLFVLEHAIEGASNAAAFYRPTESRSSAPSMRSPSWSPGR
jgi:hypothetical protein